MSAGVLLLAAGAGRRFGADKRFARLPGGTTLLQSAARNILAAGLPLCVCLGEEDAAAALLDEPGLTLLPCPGAREGMGRTLAEGMVRAPRWEITLIALADMPWIAADTFRAVAAACGPEQIVVPTLAGRRGHPVAFAAGFYPALAALGGDRGARALLDRYPGALRELPLDDPGILRDVDRPADLQAAPAVALSGGVITD